MLTSSLLPRDIPQGDALDQYIQDVFQAVCDSIDSTEFMDTYNIASMICDLTFIQEWKVYRYTNEYKRRGGWHTEYYDIVARDVLEAMKALEEFAIAFTAKSFTDHIILAMNPIEHPKHILASRTVSDNNLRKEELQVQFMNPEQFVLVGSDHVCNPFLDARVIHWSTDTSLEYRYDVCTNQGVIEMV